MIPGGNKERWVSWDQGCHLKKKKKDWLLLVGYCSSWNYCTYLVYWLQWGWTLSVWACVAEAGHYTRMKTKKILSFLITLFHCHPQCCKEMSEIGIRCYCFRAPWKLLTSEILLMHSFGKEQCPVSPGTSGTYLNWEKVNRKPSCQIHFSPCNKHFFLPLHTSSSVCKTLIYRPCLQPCEINYFC